MNAKVQQQTQVIVLVSKEEGSNVKVHPSNEWINQVGGQGGQGNGGIGGGVQLGKELAQIDNWAHHYAFLVKTDIEASDAVIICTIFICDQMLLFYNLGSTYPYVSIQYAVGLNLVYDVLDQLVYVFTLVGEFVVVTYVYHSDFMSFMGIHTQVELIILDRLYFYVILI